MTERCKECGLDTSELLAKATEVIERWLVSTSQPGVRVDDIAASLAREIFGQDAEASEHLARRSSVADAFEALGAVGLEYARRAMGADDHD